jgi:hypothetical protein
VSIVTVLRAGQPGNRGSFPGRVQDAYILSTATRPALGLTQPSTVCVPGSSPRRQTCLVMKRVVMVSRIKGGAFISAGCAHEWDMREGSWSCCHLATELAGRRGEQITIRIFFSAVPCGHVYVGVLIRLWLFLFPYLPVTLDEWSKA